MKTREEIEDYIEKLLGYMRPTLDHPQGKYPENHELMRDFIFNMKAYWQDNDA
jgi:hypothetical protein